MDPRVLRGMRTQLEARRAALERGARRVGWKIGVNVPAAQRALGIDSCVLGHLTSRTLLSADASHSLAGSVRVCVEPEIAIHLGADLEAGAKPERVGRAIAALGPAFELMDFDAPLEDLERIVARNVFHRGVLFGPPHSGFAGGALTGIRVRTERNGEPVHECDAERVAPDPRETLRFAAEHLAACGEQLRAGDRILSGSLTLVPVRPGDRVRADFGSLGRLEIRFVD